MLWICQAELHHRDQAHPARKRFCAFSEQAQRFVQRLGSREFKLLVNHAVLPAWLPYVISFQSFSGVSGMSRLRTPKGESASTTEFTTAGDAPMVPASP